MCVKSIDSETYIGMSHCKNIILSVIYIYFCLLIKLVTSFNHMLGFYLLLSNIGNTSKVAGF